MNKENIGIFIGSIQTFIGHPLDTLKTNLQQNKKNNIYNIRELYRGIYFPMISSVSSNFVLFYFFENKKYNILYRYTNNPYLLGMYSGFLASPIINYLDVLKIKRQLNIKINYQNKKLIYLGLHLTILRK